jgi:hypothetical protein
MAEIVLSNAVLLAENLNPSIFRETWLVKEGVFTENEIKVEESFFSSTAVNVLTPHVALLVVPERLQLAFKTDEKQDEIIMKTIGNIVKALPHTPYKAIGFNFDWVTEPTDQNNFPKTLQEMFLSDKNPLRNSFNTEDTRFGMYVSKDELEMRLSLDMKPIIGSGEKAGKEALKFHFNFHKSISIDNREKAVEIISETAKKWLDAKKISEDIVKEVSKGWTV